MNIKYSFLVIILLTMQFLSCSGGEKVLIYRATERSDVDIVGGRAGLIRTLYCDLYIEYVDRESWNYLKSFKVFKGNGWGLPVDPCFHFIIVNTWNKPFVIEKVEVFYKDESIPSEDFSFIKDSSYLESRYSINLFSILKRRRIFSGRVLVKDIDFESDTAEYKLNFIAPGDNISFFSFFKSIPSGKLSKIRVAIKYLDVKKVIDFDIGRFEYKNIEDMEHL